MSVAKLPSHRRHFSGLYAFIVIVVTCTLGCAEAVIDEAFEPSTDTSSTQSQPTMVETKIIGGQVEDGFTATVLIETVAPSQAVPQTYDLRCVTSALKVVWHLVRTQVHSKLAQIQY